jgi:AraC-like DNA-binding protein
MRRGLTTCVLEHGIDAAPWAASGSTASGVVTLAFAGSPDARMRFDGREILSDAIGVWPGATRVSIVARSRADWFVMTVPETAWTSLARPAGDATPGTVFVTRGPRPVRPEDLAHVRALATSALAGAEDAGPVGSSSETASLLEHLLLAQVAKLTHGPTSNLRRDRSPRIDRCSVLARVEAALDARPSDPLYLEDLCTATGLAERTLRHILVEQYGASPIRVLRNRRLCDLRRSLLAQDDGTEGLARIAARHGFWHMGTLAGDYRKLFGELPSETRRHGNGTVTEPAPATRAVASRSVLRRPVGGEPPLPGAGPAV